MMKNISRVHDEIGITAEYLRNVFFSHLNGMNRVRSLSAVSIVLPHDNFQPS